MAIRTFIFSAMLSLLASAQTLDPAQFSLKENPHGPWQYGYSETRSLSPGQFRLDKSTGTLGEIGFWHPSVSDSPGPGYYPYVAYNPSKDTQLGSSNGWSARSGEFAMEGSNSGQYSIVRFVAPVKGTYSVQAHFAGVHFGLSTTDVHVMHDEKSLFAAEIEGYGGDPSSHPVQGASPTANYDGEAKLKANDIITFAVGYGKNQTNYGDTTGLFAEVVLIKKH
ncbi:MAG TPA: hypothetical protein VH088_20565 [Terriglobales bacterium]|jgi:hypothetical protein|nr:hypothetical protein [Terriglobales bacterium]